MNVPAIVKRQVETKLRTCHALAEAHYGRTFAFPSIEYTVRGTTGGKAWGSNRVGFNAVLLMENVDAFIARTVPHELAHCIDYVVNPHNHRRTFRGQKRTVHGRDWKRVMAVLGAADATRCHKYDTTNSAVRQKTKHEWACNNCKATMKLGPIRHKKQLKAESYRPRGCSWAHTYRYLGVVGAPQPTQLPAAAQTAAQKPKASKSHNRPGSKKARAETIYQGTRVKDRTAIIARFVSSLDMTPAGAATYYANCKKKFG